VPLIRNTEGVWRIEGDEHDRERIENWNPVFREALPRYLTALDSAFNRAQKRSQFQFLLSLFRIRGLEDAGWDPYQTTLRAIPAMHRVHDYIIEKGENEAAQHLGLWVYGHIVEASEPYELLANLIDVAKAGGLNSIDFLLIRAVGRKVQGRRFNNFEKWQWLQTCQI
jgi:hypothetical protein